MASTEQKKSYQVIKQFKGLNTKANRTAIEENEFSWLENAMPIGSGNIKTTPGIEVLTATFTDTIVNLFAVSIGLTDYILAFYSNGSAAAVNLTTEAVTTIGTSFTFSTTGNVNVAQYKNKYVAIIDATKGYFTWDGSNLISVGSVARIGIVAQGSGYKSAPTITISAPNQMPGGIQATAVCAVTNTAGTVIGATITTPGSGYTSVPVATVPEPPYPGIRAELSVGLSGTGTVVQINVLNPGSGYTSNATITFTGGGGTGAAATAIVDSGSITAIAVTNAGSGYTSPPTITFSGGGGTGASAQAELLTFATGTVSVNVLTGGYGYTNAANTVVAFTGGGGGSGAAAKAIISGGQVTQILMTNHGSGYTTAPTVSVTGGGATVNATAEAAINEDENTAISSFSGRMWIASGRNVFYSSSFSLTDFTSLSAGSISLSDSTLHGKITQIISANNFLYIFGDDSINVFSDVRVTGQGTTLFTNTNISASVGTSRKYAIFPYFRSLLFMNDYGIYALVGSTTTKISDALDGIFPYIDFTKPVYAGQVLINNILCAAFNFNYTGTGGGGAASRYIQAIFFDKKWFLTSTRLSFNAIDYTSPKFIVSSPIGGKITMYGVRDVTGGGSSNYLFKLYSDEAGYSQSYIQTALLPMQDPIRTKQALKYGIEVTNNTGYPLNVSVDSEQQLGTTVIPNPTTASWTNSVKVGSIKMNVNYYGKYANSIIDWMDFPPESYIKPGCSIVNANPNIISGTLITNYGYDDYEGYWIINLNRPTNCSNDSVQQIQIGDIYSPENGVSVSWSNIYSQAVTWTTGAPYYLFKGDAQQWGKYIGMTVSSNDPGMTYNTFEFEHELRTRF